jgi:hypothetical protein
MAMSTTPAAARVDRSMRRTVSSQARNGACKHSEVLAHHVNPRIAGVPDRKINFPLDLRNETQSD